MEKVTSPRIYVSKKVTNFDGMELLDYFKTNDENIVHSFKDSRDRIFFTSHKIVLVDFSGLIENRKQILCIPYKSIIGISIESSGHFNSKSELSLFVRDLGNIVVEMGKDIDVKAVSKFLNTKIL